jgi:hypothetical protein
MAMLCKAQTENFKFIGTLETAKSKPIIIQFELQINNNRATGYSITDFQGPNETKAAFEGTYNYKTGSLFLHETMVQYTKAKNATVFCLLYFDTKMVSKNKQTSISGKSWGIHNEDTCFSGTISLVLTSYVLEKLDVAKNKIAKAPISQEKKQTIKQNTESYQSSIKTVFIKKGELVQINSNSDSCEIWLWDNETEDGDKITLKINGVNYLTNFEVKTDKKMIPCIFSKENVSEFNIEVIAISEGTRAPNTTNFLIKIGETEHKFEAYLRKSESAIIHIKR